MFFLESFDSICFGSEEPSRRPITESGISAGDSGMEGGGVLAKKRKEIKDLVVLGVLVC